MAGSEVAITVESMFSMKREHATIRGMRTVRCTVRILRQERRERSARHPGFAATGAFRLA